MQTTVEPFVSPLFVNHTTEILMKFVDPEEEEEGGMKLSFTSEFASEWRGGGARSLSDK